MQVGKFIIGIIVILLIFPFLAYTLFQATKRRISHEPAMKFVWLLLPGIFIIMVTIVFAMSNDGGIAGLILVLLVFVFVCVSITVVLMYAKLREMRRR
ncbi:MAG TPA: hypothetical protein VFA41_06720 [Ktedonobacteraceae bacterium]|jgi:ABC-type xylose transport system permease subunit|nr:hypothetical protein [Ktedonobacteraceae bacterium]